MANILFLTELLPYPLVSGAKIRAYYVLRHLSIQHQVILLSFVRADDRPEDLAHLETFLTEVHTVPMMRSRFRDLRAILVALATGCPAIIVREEIGAMRAAVGRLTASVAFDIIHVDQIPMAQYGLMGQRARPRGRGSVPHPSRLLDQHNTTFQLVERLAQHEGNRLKRWILQREARAFARYEADVCQRYDQVTFVSDQDRHALLAKAALLARTRRTKGLVWSPSARPGMNSVKDLPSFDSQFTTIPICVDTGKDRPVASVARPFRVTHIGTMFWPPNVEGILWFWQEVWPQVRSQARRAAGRPRLTLIGKNPPESIRALGMQADVDVLGYVEELRPFLAETAVFIVPLHAAGGMRVKILDAWCWGLPIVSTTIGAEGLAAQDGAEDPGGNMLVADSPTAFAQAVVQVLGDAGLRDRLRVNGRLHVEQRYDWRRVYSAWDDVYARLV
jgi:glycosyltransferase involved in cell wall biosynthesis